MLIILLALFSCNNSPPIAPEVTFYFEIQVSNQNQLGLEVKKELEEYFPKRKYAMTNSSAYTEPYYEEFKLDENVPLDSIIPPHTFAHRMEILGEDYPENSRLLKIQLFPGGKSEYSMEIYKRENNNWVFLAQTGVHPIPERNGDKEDLIKRFRESIIRYSFK